MELGSFKGSLWALEAAHTPLLAPGKTSLKPLFVGIYVGESHHFVGFLNGGAEWISSIYAQALVQSFIFEWVEKGKGMEGSEKE